MIVPKVIFNHPITADFIITSSKKAVSSILPGGEKHDLFKKYLDNLVDFLLGCKIDDGTYVPILFRPFHEHIGSWFWWRK